MEDDDYSSDSSDEYVFESEEETRVAPQKPKEPFQVITASDAVVLMKEAIKSVQSIIELPSTDIRIFMHHHKWDGQRLLDMFYEDVDKFYKDAGVVIGNDAPAEAKDLSGKSLCDICYDMCEKSDFNGLKCGHKYCSNCWSEYLYMKIKESSNAVAIDCPAHKCNITVDDDTVMRYVTDPLVRARYERAITNSFIENTHDLTRCPSEECDKIIKVLVSKQQEVQCTCKLSFCFECGEPWHEPLDCTLVNKWNKKLSMDSETANWVATNTKDCPKCKNHIHKVSGCNHMTCGAPTCRFEFCWHCMKDWKSYRDNHECKKYVHNPESKKSPADKLRRFAFYENFYRSHFESLKLEGTLYAQTRLKMKDCQEKFNRTYTDVMFLEKAVDTLRQCRLTLMYTYVFRFYVDDNVQVILFDNNQNDLQKRVEELSGFLDKEIKTNQSFDELRQEVLNLTRYCEGRRNTVISHVKEGYDNDSWKWDFDV